MNLNIDNSCANWPNKWFGIFGAADDGFPSVHDFVDREWIPSDKLKLVTYLRNAPYVLEAVSGEGNCEICGAEFNLGAYQSDGIWLWPEDLPHMIEIHNVRPPDALVARIRESMYVPPETCDTDLDKLPWPRVT